MTISYTTFWCAMGATVVLFGVLVLLDKMEGMKDTMKLRWIIEEDGTRRLQYAPDFRPSGDGVRHHEWADVPEVPADEEYN
jgi:hypothetical protein